MGIKELVLKFSQLSSVMIGTELSQAYAKGILFFHTTE